MADEQKNVTTISTPQPDPSNVEAVKRFVFNETGNIMMASTDESSDNIAESVRQTFSEVSVFFAAMTKAISQTINPNGNADLATGKKPYYNLYNYDALEAVIDGSGLFVHVNEEDVRYITQTVGVTLSKELVEAVIGLAAGAGELKFANALVNSMGKEGLRIQNDYSKKDTKVANIIFVCEYLLGMPVVSALVVTADSKTVSDHFQLGPCVKVDYAKTDLTLHKDTYMFVPPKFIKEFGGDLVSGLNDPRYLELINMLQGLVERLPETNGLFDMSDIDNPTRVTDGNITVSKKYAIFGQYLGNKTATAKLELKPTTGAAIEMTVDTNMWNNSGIQFTIPSDAPATTSGNLLITLADGKTTISAGTFTIKAAT